jgi:hypothetical protein
VRERSVWRTAQSSRRGGGRSRHRPGPSGSLSRGNHTGRLTCPHSWGAGPNTRTAAVTASGRSHRATATSVATAPHVSRTSARAERRGPRTQQLGGEPVGQGATGEERLTLTDGEEDRARGEQQKLYCPGAGLPVGHIQTRPRASRGPRRLRRRTRSAAAPRSSAERRRVWPWSASGKPGKTSPGCPRRHFPGRLAWGSSRHAPRSGSPPPHRSTAARTAPGSWAPASEGQIHRPQGDRPDGRAGEQVEPDAVRSAALSCSRPTAAPGPFGAGAGGRPGEDERRRLCP